jgi:hypothetical protein
MTTNKIYINQSLVKDLIKYQNDELCGLVFHNKWILQQFGGGSKANDLGHYFEWLCTGALAKGESEAPIPETTKSGELTADFKTAKKQAEYFHSLLPKYGIKLLDAGNKIIADDTWIGTLDIEAKWDAIFENENLNFDTNNKDHIVIIDLKYSGLLNDKWNEFGWHDETLGRKQGTMLQAKHYKFLYWKKYGFNPPFFFFVFDSKQVGKAKIINVEIDTYELELHEEFLQKAKRYFEMNLESGFQPKPSYDLCISCKYQHLCSFKIDKPKIISVKPE